MSTKKAMIAITMLCAIFIAVIHENAFASGGSKEDSDYNIDYTRVDLLFDEDFDQQYNVNFLDKISRSEVVIGNRYYSLMSSGNIYYFDADTNSYGFLTSVTVPQTGIEYQGVRYSDLEEAERQVRDQSVFQLIGAVDSNTLYGYCSTSGRIGIIDESGIHWSDVPLDNFLQMEKDEIWPEPLYFAYIEGNSVYAYCGSTEWPDNNSSKYIGQLLTFDMQTGKCVLTELPQTYAFCPYTNGQMLLLRCKDDGQMYLSSFDHSTHLITEEQFPVLPLMTPADGYESVVFSIAGLAFHEQSGSIVYSDVNGVWQSVQGNAFHHVELGQKLWEDLTPRGQAWIMQNGSYIFPNSGKHMFS